MVFLNGCIAIPPEPILISSAPRVAGSACDITIVRENTLFGSAMTHYISLDKVIVAEIDRGEYTQLQVSEGHHSIGVNWRVGNKAASVAYVDVMKWNLYNKEIKLDCKPPATHNFLVIIKPLKLDENERVEFKKVDSFEGEFSVKKYTYVKPGPR